MTPSEKKLFDKYNSYTEVQLNLLLNSKKTGDENKAVINKILANRKTNVAYAEGHEHPADADQSQKSKTKVGPVVETPAAEPVVADPAPVAKAEVPAADPAPAAEPTKKEPTALKKTKTAIPRGKFISSKEDVNGVTKYPQGSEVTVLKKAKDLTEGEDPVLGTGKVIKQHYYANKPNMYYVTVEFAAEDMKNVLVSPKRIQE